MKSGRKLATRRYFLLDRVPDQPGRVRPVELVDRDDPRRGGDVDLGQPFAVDDVDADEEQAAPLELGSERGANLLLAVGQLGLRRRTADCEVRAYLALPGNPVDRAGHVSIDQH